APRPRWGRELGAIALLGILLLAALFHRLFADPFAYFSTDNSELYFPWFVMLGRALREGHWPFLDPYWFAGSLPIAALESGALYPPVLVAAALARPSASLDAVYLVFLAVSLAHYLLGTGAMYWLARRQLGVGAVAAACGALCYGFGGSFVGRFAHQPVLFTL